MLLLPVGIMYYCRERRLLLGKKKDDLLQQFKELLQLTVASLKAGYSAENAFLKGREDMAELFGEESEICRILGLLKTGLQNNRSLSGLWQEIGKICQIEEITDFAEVFSVAKEKRRQYGVGHGAGLWCDRGQGRNEKGDCCNA